MDAEHIRELFSEFRPVEVRRMFGGVGVSAEGYTFAIAFEGVLYLRADAALVPDLKAAGSTPFVYPYAKYRRPRKNPDAAPFWRMPEHLYDDPAEAARWAQRAFAVAQAKQAGKRKAGAGRKSPRVQGKKPAAKRAAAKSVKKPASGAKRKAKARRAR